MLLVMAVTAVQVIRRPSADEDLDRLRRHYDALQRNLVTVDTGATPDGGTYTFKVAGGPTGDLCDELSTTFPVSPRSATPEPPRLAGGGGGCGTPGPVASSTSGTDYSGVTTKDVAYVDVVGTTDEKVRVATKPLPSAFGDRRYFVLFLTAGHPREAVFTAQDGKVLKRITF